MKKSLKFITIIIFCIFFFSNKVLADVGDTGGFGGSGGSGGSSGGSGGYNWGSSSNYGNNYNNSGPSNPMSFLVMIGAGIFVMVSKVRRQGNSYTSNQQSTYNVDLLDEESALTKMRELDPNFNLNAFNTYVSDCFLEVQRAWGNNDEEGLRVHESNQLYSSHRKSLQKYINGNTVNKLTNQKVFDVTLADVEETDTQIKIVVRLNASLSDYICNRSNGDIISGDMHEVFKRAYCLKFIRSKTLKSNAIISQSSTCPICNEPLKITNEGSCSYCKIQLMNGDFNWVLDEYSAWKFGSYLVKR